MRIKIKDVIHAVLSDDEKTRNSDKLLVLEVYRRFGIDTKKPFGEILFADAPSYESIGRIRRKLQEKFPELRASENVEIGRNANRARYFKFSKDECLCRNEDIIG